MDNAKITSVIKNVAKKQATDVMDPDDLEQEFWVFALEELIPRDHPEGTVVDLIKKQGVKIVGQERIDYMQFRGAFIYSPAVVRTTLEDSVWTNEEDAPDIEGRMDASSALAQLSEHERDLLVSRFAPKSRVSPDLSRTDYKHIESAIDKISMTLNRGASRSELDIETAAEQPAVLAFA